MPLPLDCTLSTNRYSHVYRRRDRSILDSERIPYQEMYHLIYSTTNTYLLENLAGFKPTRRLTYLHYSLGRPVTQVQGMLSSGQEYRSVHYPVAPVLVDIPIEVFGDH